MASAHVMLETCVRRQDAILDVQEAALSTLLTVNDQGGEQESCFLPSASGIMLPDTGSCKKVALVHHRHLHIMTTIDTTNCRLTVERISKKIAHLDTDIKFLQSCKKADKIPKGLQITNPLKSTYNSDYAERLCRRTSRTLRNHLIHQLYSRRHNLETKIESILSTCTQDTADQLRYTAKQTRQRNYAADMKTKSRKLEKLGITTSNDQASPGTTVATTGKSIVNLSDHTLQPDEIEVLSRGLNFCPTTKMDPTSLAADTEEFIRRMRLREFYHKPQDFSSEPNETIDDPEQQTEGSAVQQPKRKESNWTPPEGRCPQLDMYAQAVRKCGKGKAERQEDLRSIAGSRVRRELNEEVGRGEDCILNLRRS
ncbi:uncharacterized protein [Heptranchias perlo]|uniref:uncharacterized protein n=1 Tax=Heptranchias perlo TaxID=212740 RepID=UPI00355A87D2